MVGSVHILPVSQSLGRGDPSQGLVLYVRNLQRTAPRHIAAPSRQLVVGARKWGKRGEGE